MDGNNHPIDTASQPVIDRLDAYWLRLPLLVPYENSLGTLSDFDVILVSVSDGSGRTGWGEACPVKGYSPEDPAQAWQYAGKLLPRFKGMTGSDILRHLDEWFVTCPFLVSAISEALEDLESEPLLRLPEARAIELAGTVNTLQVLSAAQKASDLVEKGYRTLKVKVGYDPKKDAHRVNAIAEAVGSQAKLRVDANQGYDVEAALLFARSVSPAAIEYFEQPVASHDWPAIAAVAGQSPVPIMLDEAIYSDDDIRRSSTIPGVTAIKLKLSKAGGARGLFDQFHLAQSLGLQVVVGNGIASDLGCMHEAMVCLHAGMTSAGEMNGFLKTDVRLVQQSLNISGPRLVIPAVSDVQISKDFDTWIHEKLTCA